MHNTELYHHGVEGMKWGVRRYQNKDGTLTEAGHRRLQQDRDRNSLKKKENRLPSDALKEDNRYNPQRWANEDNEALKRVLDSGRNATNSASDLLRITNNIRSNKSSKRMDLSNMSDKELRDRINREMLERQYNDVFNTRKESRGREYLANTLNVAGGVLAVGSSAVAIALGIAQLNQLLTQ